MIKRQFYRLEHGDKNDASSDSSSSSDSDVEAEASEESGHGADAYDVEAEESEDSDHDAVATDAAGSQDGNCSTSSGYESEDSSVNDLGEDPPAGSTDEDDPSRDDKQQSSGRHLSKSLDRKADCIPEKESEPLDMPDCVMQFKSVYRCRICPRIICLTDETMSAHLKSKRHARSVKLLKENRLKAALNSDGEIENQETAAEMNARVIAIAEQKSKNKKNKGRQRQRNRMRKKLQKTGDGLKVEAKTKESTGGLPKKRQKK